jgi:hypothetical protein
MLNKISWHSFITFVVIAVITYYIIVGILYFRTDVMRLLKDGIKRNKQPAPSIGSTSNTELFSSVHELMEELKGLFAQGYPKEELITALTSKLKAYTHLKNTNLEKAVDDHIIQSANSVCNVDIDDNDIKRIW